MIRFERATIARDGDVVVDQFSLAVPPGQAAAVIGRSGAGKSSLLAAAATAVPLHAGDILVDGRSVRREPAAVRRLVGYTPDRLPGWPAIRVGEFLELCGGESGLRGPALAAAVDKALRLAGLETRRLTGLDRLAAGHAKRLLIARSLLHDPQVLLLDDPFGGLDPHERADVERLIEDAHLMGRTVLAAIDDALVPGCFTHLAVMREGRLAAAGPATADLLAPGRPLSCRLVCPGRSDEAARALGRLADDVRAVDLDAVSCRIIPDRTSIADLVAGLVHAGLPVAAAGFDPAWTAQLLDD
jgi:ABC-type multidrug transport system ATPase subunit